MAAVEDLTGPDSLVRERADLAGAAIRGAGGVARAADAIEKLGVAE